MLSSAVESYLALRRAMGFQLTQPGYQLRSYARFASERGEQFIRAATAIEWASLGASPPQRARRLGVIVRFARYLHAEDQHHEVPPADVFGSQSRPRPTPFIFAPEQIQQLLAAASSLRPRGSLRPYTYTTLFALLTCTGLRVSEAIRLRFPDLTPDGLVIRQSKFRKSRLVPLHETARAGLERYLARRRLLSGTTDHLFVSERGEPLHYDKVAQAFHTSLSRARLDSGSGHRRPSLHSLRHTFAVRALETCPEGRDQISRHTLALSSYLGHYKVAATYWYLEATPTLMVDIAKTCERFMSGERQ